MDISGRARHAIAAPVRTDVVILGNMTRYLSLRASPQTTNIYLFAPVLPRHINSWQSLLQQKLFFRAEQGLGNTIQFARYLRLLKSDDYRAIFEAPSVRLFGRVLRCNVAEI
jgi:hypothetical protein